MKNTHNVLCLGDVVSPASVEFLRRRLWNFRQENDISFVMLNGENASFGNGLTRTDAQALLDLGADVITSGNHIWQKKDIREFLDDSDKIIRPGNYPSENPGRGCTRITADGYIYLVMNVSGVVFSEPLDNPFDSVEKMLNDNKDAYDYALLDIHGEATSEKYAIARCFDGRISAVVGTHTHVQTADEQIFRGGTGYITDLGMCGPRDSILGVKNDCIINKLRYHMPVKFEPGEGDIEAHGVIFALDTETKMAVSVKRVVIQ